MCKLFTNILKGLTKRKINKKIEKKPGLIYEITNCPDNFKLELVAFKENDELKVNIVIKQKEVEEAAQ